MTTAEFTQLLIALVAVGGFILSMRSTSYTELKGLYSDIRRDFEDYKKQSEKKETEYEQKVDELATLNEKFRRYIDRLIRQLEKNGITPEKMDDL
jgi:hypothetical protein